MAIKSVNDYMTKVVTGGSSHTSTFRKTSSSATTQGVWCDLSMAPGHPVTNFYASSPLVAATLLAREGIQHAGNQSPAQKYLKRITTMGPIAPTTLLLLDYLLYYPFIDGDSTDEQFFDNTVTLPRYTSGNGVSAFVVAQGAYIGGARFFIKYTNQNGVSGRISQFCTSNTSTFSGTLISSGVAAGTFGWNIPLQQGDLGVRSVESFTFESANGGIYSLVLCKDIGAVSIREANAPSEKDFFMDTGSAMPEIQDGAYLNFLALSNASIAAQTFFGSLQIVHG